MFLVGCSKTTVVLLPDSNNLVGGQVTVSSESGTQVLDQPNQYTEVSSKSSSPSAPAVMEKEKIDADFSDVIAALPLRPVSFFCSILSSARRI